MRFFLLACLLACFVTVGAQTPPDNPLKGKVIGVYVSKKNFTFSEPFYKLFAHFTETNDTMNLSEESLKMGATIKLGEYLLQNIKNTTGADSVYLVNTVPAAARLFVEFYAQSLTQFGQVAKHLPQNTDYVLVVDQLKCTAEQRKGVFVISNHIINRQTEVKLANNNLKLIDFKRKTLTTEALNVAWDEQAAYNDLKIQFPAAANSAPAVKFLAANYSVAFSALFKAMKE